MKRILVTGVSGVGKSTVIRRLAELGHRAVDLDSDEWSEWVDSSTGGPSPQEPGKDWVWRTDRVRDLLTSADNDDLFVSGCSSNMGSFRDHFNVVVLLSVPTEVMTERLTHRTTNAYGKGPGELTRSLEFKSTIEPLLRSTADHELNGNAPLDEVITQILAFAAASDT